MLTIEATLPVVVLITTIPRDELDGHRPRSILILELTFFSPDLEGKIPKENRRDRLKCISNGDEFYWLFY